MNKYKSKISHPNSGSFSELHVVSCFVRQAVLWAHDISKAEGM